MNIEKTILLLEEEFAGLNIELNADMRRYTTFKTGGKADIMLHPNSLEELQHILYFVKSNDLPFVVLGKCSNILVSDKGIRELVIKTNDAENTTIKGEILRCECGVDLRHASVLASKMSLSGLEFCINIPGSVGGGIRMNSGAFGEDLSKICMSVKYFNGKTILNCRGEDAGFCYRESKFGGENIVLSSDFKLQKDSKKAILLKMNDYKNKRALTQPKGNLAGSIFKKYENYSAGFLIEKCGLKGKRIGGAEISNIHAGFIVNVRNSTSMDILSLIYEIKNTIYEKFKIELKEEIKFIGEI